MPKNPQKRRVDSPTKNRPKERKVALDAKSLFMKEVSKYRQLSCEEQKDLNRKIRESRDPEVREALVNTMIHHNLRLVLFILRNFNFDEDIYMDMVQKSVIKLRELVASWDPDRGNLSTYVGRVLTMELLDESIHVNTALEYPESFYFRRRDILKGKRRLQKLLGRTPSVEELAVEVGMHKDTVQGVLGSLKPQISLSEVPMSFSKVFGIDLLDWDLDPHLTDYVRDENDIEEGIIEHDLISRVMENVFIDDAATGGYSPRVPFQLSAKQVKVLRLFYEFEINTSYDVPTLADIGRELGLTRERVRQLLEEVLHKLKGRKPIIQIMKELDIIKTPKEVKDIQIDTRAIYASYQESVSGEVVEKIDLPEETRAKILRSVELSLIDRSDFDRQKYDPIFQEGEEIVNHIWIGPVCHEVISDNPPLVATAFVQKTRRNREGSRGHDAACIIISEAPIRRRYIIDNYDGIQELEKISFMLEFDHRNKGEHSVKHRYIAPELRGQGLGSDIMKVYEKYIQKMADKDTEKQTQSSMIATHKLDTMLFALSQGYVFDTQDDGEAFEQIKRKRAKSGARIFINDEGDIVEEAREGNTHIRGIYVTLRKDFHSR